MKRPAPVAQNTAAPPDNQPLIPFDTVDPASQRLYVVAFYIVLWAWRLYDFYSLIVDDTESFWLFLKWLAIDGIFLFGLPSLRIPWLEWSNPVMAALFGMHALVNGMLMFKIGIPVSSWIIAFTKLLYDKELAISERRVSPNEIVHNASLILGRQVIHILPEGSAMLNPGGEAFCLGASKTQALLPIQINQTTPVSIELLRVDIDTAEEEIVTISSSTARKLKKEASKSLAKGDTNSPVVLRYPVKKPGYYTLRKVIDESRLEVQPRRSHAMVVTCPSARVKQTLQNRCRNDLSDITLEAHGTPPLKLRYRKVVNQEEAQKGLLQGLQPDDFTSPLSKQSSSDAIVKAGSADVSWARASTIAQSVNETLQKGGLWTYEIEEVQDALGNVVNYDHLFQEEEKSKIQNLGLQQSVFVHERPIIRMHGCDPQHPIRVPKGHSTALPIQYGSTAGSKRPVNGAHSVELWYTPEQDIQEKGGRSVNAVLERINVQTYQAQHPIRDPGLYTLSSVNSDFCSGEVEEPASCIVQNPPEPEVIIQDEDITDKCARKPIGKKLYLTLTGTPPFKLAYTERRDGDRAEKLQHVVVQGNAGEITLQPREAGSYEYHFKEISDAVYQSQSLAHQDLRIKQTVHPPPDAALARAGQVEQTCNGGSPSFDVYLQGEGPWDVEYELVHNGKRSTSVMKGIAERYAQISLGPLTSGGEYTLGLKSVVDSSGCKEYLKDDVKIRVRHQQPKVAFAAVDGKFTIKALDGEKRKLPIRLTGEGPWVVTYNHGTSPDEKNAIHKTVQKANDEITVSQAGMYHLLTARDAACPGMVDDAAKTFEVSWVDRPTLHIAESDYVKATGETSFIKQAICEGDDDTLDLSMNGAPPFKLVYEEHRKPATGAKSVRKRDVSGAIGPASIAMDAAQAGQYEYKFTELSDANYRHSSQHFRHVTVEQTVLARPTARFSQPGKTYSYCATDDEKTSTNEEAVETIPLKLTGHAPFSIEVELKHHSAARPEVISIPHIPSHSYNLRIPHRHLHLGSSALTIRKVRDSRGCRSAAPGHGSSPQQNAQHERVLVSVHSAPTITPLEPQTDYCVGDRLSFTISGQPPFNVFYTFQNQQLKASSAGTAFRRLAERPGVFAVTAVSDSASRCRAPVGDAVAQGLYKVIHPLPAVRVSNGRDTRVDIHEGGEAEILFEFDGSPPFEFTWTRSSLGRKPQVLETRTDQSEGYSLKIKASEEGSYEVVAIRDRYCGVSKVGGKGGNARVDKLLTY